MNHDFEEQIRHLQKRLQQLSERVDVAEEEEELEVQNEELRATRADLDAERRRYEALFNFAPGGYLVTDRQGVIREANQAAATLLHIAQKHLAGKPLALFVPEADQPAYYAHLSRARAGKTGPLSPFQIRLQPRTGDAFHASITVAPGRDGEEKVTTLRWLIRDITARIEAQRALKQRELRLQLLNTISTGLIKGHTTDEIVHHTIRQLEAALPEVRAAYCTIDSEGELCVRHAAEHPEMPSRKDLRMNLTTAPAYHKRLQWGQYVASDDVSRDERLGPLADFYTQGGSRATLDVPIKQWDALTGLLCFDAPRPYPWSDFEIDLLTDVAQQLSMAFRQRYIERERRRVEKALMENETHLREAQRLGRIGSWRYDVEADAITWSETMYELYERSPQEGTPADLQDNLDFLYPPEDAARLAAVVQRAIEDAEPYELDLKVNLPSGKIAYHHAIGTPITDEHGKVVELRGTAQDITKRKVTELALKRQQERLEALHQADRAILEARKPSEIAGAVMPYLQKIKPEAQITITAFDFEADQMKVLAAHVHAPDSRIEPGATIALDDVWFLNKLQTGARYTEEDLSTLSVESSLADVLDEAGVEAFTIFPLTAQRVLLGALNVALPGAESLETETLKAFEAISTQLAIGLQQARLQKALRAYNEELQEMVERRTASLRATEARFRATFEGAAVGIAQLTGDGEIIESNPTLAKLLGYDGSQLAGRRFTEFLHDDEVDQAIEHYRALLAGERDYYRHELQMQRANGDMLDTQVTISTQAETEDHPHIAIAMVEDITEAKAAQAELIQAEKLTVTGRLAASLAHEINNPLQTVIGALGLAREVLDEGGDADRYMDISMRELERAARIVANLRNLNRPAHLEERERVRINTLLEDVLTLTEKRSQNRNLDVVWVPAPADPQIFIVRDRMQQVFLNLVLNAIEAMPEGGELHITAAQTDDPAGVQVQIADSGVGIPQEEQTQLFDAFYTTKSEGVGLGLYVTHRIVTDHGGRIEVESHVGDGTTFTVWIPDTPEN